MTPQEAKEDSEENQNASGGAGSNDGPDGTAPDSETQSSAASNQGRDNNPDIREAETGGSTFEQAEGDDF